MPFRKNHEYCWKPDEGEALDPSPVCFKASAQLKNQLKSIPDWQKKLRASLPDLISQWSELGETSDAANID